MNNKGSKEPVAQKRGFYIALYSILAALLVLAGVISYNNYTAVNRAREMRAQIAADELHAVSASQVQDYLTQHAARTAPSPTPAVPRNTTPSPGTAPRTAPAVPGVTATPAPRTTPTAPSGQPTPNANPSPAPSAETQPTPEQPAPNASPAPSTNTAPAQQPEAEPAAPSSTPIPPPRNNRSSEVAPPLIEVFTEGDTMRWPVLGEVVMDFSNDRMVYDRTLEQFRTNDILCIATDIGTPVHAAAGGVVKSVTQSRELGNTIMLDHGNGWTTSYSQLQDGVLVREGDTVSTGQVIGGVGAPSLYYVLLGNHLGFKVSHNDSYLDPKMLLE